MTNPGNKDIVRYTLQSYVGKMFTDTEISSRQKEAIQRLNTLREDKFQEFCHDVINEIHRRSGVKYNADNKMIQRFSMLSTERFKNLVVDTLIVYYQKNPEARVEEMPAFLENLGNLIEALKIDSERESFLERLKRLGFYNKLQEFVVYSVGFGIDKRIADHINESLQDSVQKECLHFIECLSYPKVLLQKIEDSELFKGYCKEKPSVFKEFQTSKELISNALEHGGDSSTVRKELIKVMRTVIHSAAIPAKKVECFEDEIKSVIGGLESIKCDVEGTSSVDLTALSENLTGTIDKVIKKSKCADLPDQAISSLHIHRVTLEGLANSASKTEAFCTVLDIAKELRNAFRGMDKASPL